MKEIKHWKHSVQTFKVNYCLTREGTVAKICKAGVRSIKAGQESFAYFQSPQTSSDFLLGKKRSSMNVGHSIHTVEDIFY